MNSMQRVSRLLFPLLLAISLITAARADIIGVTVSPKQDSADISQGQSFTVRWVVSTTPAHDSGAFSPQGQILDPVTGAILQTVATPFNRSEGAGPLHFEETLALTAAQLQTWHKQGINAVTYQRSFSSAANAPGVTGTRMTILLSGGDQASQPHSPSAGLFIHNLSLRFENAGSQPISPDMDLRAHLDLQYSGAGQLQGNWEIARENGTTPLTFTHLANISRRLPLDSQAFLISPQLPTDPGHYRLRFCVLPAVPSADQLQVDSQCPQPQLMAEMQYGVGKATDTAPAEIQLVSPQALSLTPQTPLQWKKLPGTVVYQLQIFNVASGEDLAGGDLVASMLAGADKPELHLSQRVRQLLQSGKQYRWRVTAHDADARMIGSSPVAEFTYLP